MISDTYRQTVQRHQAAIARLQQEKSREAARGADENRKAQAAREAASRSTNSSTLKSRLRDVERYEKAAAQSQTKVAQIEVKIAREHDQLHQAQKRLAAEESAELKRRENLDRKRVREQDSRLAQITGQVTQHERLHRVTLAALQSLQDLPERITVLFLAANPIDQPALRLDEEVRSIGEMIRLSEFRDVLRLEARWAVRPLDVLQAINECDPRVVHFSGHGSNDDEIVFQDSSGNAKVVTKEAIVQTLAAASSHIQLVFFNTCFSRGQAEAVVENIPAAIGMSHSISDVAARVFAAQFYSALGFGLAVGQAFDQAKAALMLEGISEESTPELFLSPGLSSADLVLVDAKPRRQ